MNVLGIESSCDETSVALLENGKILVNLIYSQIEHYKFGGVVPEVASRAHLEKIDRLTDTALNKAGLSISNVDLIAVTDSPGLAGALLVGISFALGLHTARCIPITGVNHLEGHIFSIFIEHPEIEFPFLALVASGGHTALYRVDDIDKYHTLGETVDDAAGEAFDKVGKMLGFAYPAGRAIEKEAAKYSVITGDHLKFPVARCSRGDLHFSFSGLKTAVKNFVMQKDQQYLTQKRPEICAAFQKAVTDSLVNNAIKAGEHTGIRKIVLVGGVACNEFLRRELQERFKGSVYFPRHDLCSDNAAMIALAGYKRYINNKIRLPEMNPSCRLEVAGQ